MQVTSPVLMIETATARTDHCASVALRGHDGNILGHTLEPHTQAAQLLPVIQQLLAQASLSFNALHTLAFTVGPGSFTGIRIGLAVVRTMLFSCPHLKAYPITTLQAAATALPETLNKATIALRAGKGEDYVQSFTRENALWKPSDEISLQKAPETHTQDVFTLVPDATTILQGLQHIALDNTLSAQPLYIRPPDAKLSSKALV